MASLIRSWAWVLPEPHTRERADVRSVEPLSGAEAEGSVSNESVISSNVTAGASSGEMAAMA